MSLLVNTHTGALPSETKPRQTRVKAKNSIVAFQIVSPVCSFYVQLWPKLLKHLTNLKILTFSMRHDFPSEK